MKKLFVGLFILLFASTAYGATSISVDAFISPDDVTVTHLEDQRTTFQNFLNSIDGDNLQTGSITPDQLNDNASPVTRWKETFNDFIYTGLTIPTAASLSSTTTLGTGYVSGERIEKDATAHTYTASKYTFVDLKSDGTYTYTEVAIGAADPSIAADTTRLARVSSDGTTINDVKDLRILAISLDNAQANMQRVGMQLRGTNITTEVLQVEPGIVYHGNLRRVKTTVTGLNLSTGADWVVGEAKADDTMGFVVMNNAGSILLSTTAPTLHDLAGTTGGTRYYSLVGGNYYRVLAWFYMSNDWDGNVKINHWEWGNLGVDMPWGNLKHISPDGLTSTPYWVDVPDTLMNFYSSGERIEVGARATGHSNTISYGFQICIELDGLPLEATKGGGAATQTSAGGSGGCNIYTTFVTPELTQGDHTVRMNWNQELGYVGTLVEGAITVGGN